ncbi:alpha/beta hydrolase fold domain-containing protein [Nocardioides bruguierae]|uniref:Alpha/beta hydrolase n=1 Tax=Nocardioides bruguierae TaxID=2945102 RepID=A0A9X2IH52_9ACTN|nr:alpha/beta hydrolase [Nocardioides bruguierae]MCM0621430.1 alpha/beta hydrolase [Nocardioides bruguierae]
MPRPPIVPPFDAPFAAPLVTPAGHRLLPGLAYASTDGGRPLELDVHLPLAPTDAPLPVVLFVHGGAWRVGRRTGVGPMFSPAAYEPFVEVTRAGWAVVSIDYRLTGEAAWPTQLHDVKAALRFVRHRADELGVDPDRVAIWGESAGAHLAAMAALTGDSGDASLEGSVGVTGPSTALSRAICWYTPTDLREISADRGEDPTTSSSPEALLVGGAVTDVADVATHASPVTHVHAGAPPFLLVHGTADSVVAHVQSERLRDRLAEVGVPVELVSVEGAEHAWMADKDAAQTALAAMLAALA